MKKLIEIVKRMLRKILKSSTGLLVLKRNVDSLTRDK